MTVVASENFNLANGSAWPAQWATAVGNAAGVVDIQSNAGRMEAEGANYTYARALLSGMSAIGDTDLLIKAQIADINEQYPVVSVRHSGSWIAGDPGVPQDAYFLNWLPAQNRFDLEKAVAGVRTVLGNFAFTEAAATWYWMRVQASGTTVRARVWADGGAEPGTWDVSVTDSAHASGKAALSCINGAATTARTVTWDDLTVDDMTVAGGHGPLLAMRRNRLVIAA